MLVAGSLLPAPPCDQATTGSGSGAPIGWRINSSTRRGLPATSV